MCFKLKDRTLEARIIVFVFFYDKVCRADIPALLTAEPGVDGAYCSVTEAVPAGPS